MVVVPTFSSLTSTPSTEILALRPNFPPNEIEEKANFGRVEVAAVLNLDPRLKLCEIEEVSAIDRKVFNLCRSQGSRQLRLLCIY